MSWSLPIALIKCLAYLLGMDLLAALFVLFIFAVLAVTSGVDSRSIDDRCQL